MELSELDEGFEGQETITGTSGDDSLDGTSGNDIIFGDDGTGSETSDPNTITITVENLTETGGTFQTPVWFGFHDGDFDLFDIGATASAGLEALAEDGTLDTINAEFTEVTEGAGIAGAISNGGPIAPGEIASTTITLTDPLNQGIFSWASMVIPSNDAFIASPDDPSLARVFGEDGTFLGPVEILVSGDDVLDAGTEANLELEAAFLNQTGPNTGTEGNGTVAQHLGFNGSAGNPTTENVNILAEGATTASGAEILAEAADFTLDPDAPIFRITIEQPGADGDGDAGGEDEISGGLGDDTIFGGAGDDILNGDRGDDELHGGTGDDLIFGGRGDDILLGDEGNDVLFGDRGDDVLEGGEGFDELSGDRGDDVLDGGAGDDVLSGGLGDDVFVFSEGGGVDEITDFGFGGNDQIDVSGFGFESAADFLINAEVQGSDTLLNFSTNNTEGLDAQSDDQLVIVGIAPQELLEANFII